MKDKAKELVKKFGLFSERYVDQLGQYDYNKSKEAAKQCVLICVENEYNALRELLFNLRSCRVIENWEVYSHRLDELLKEEQELKQEIQNL